MLLDTESRVPLSPLTLFEHKLFVVIFKKVASPSQLVIHWEFHVDTHVTSCLQETPTNVDVSLHFVLWVISNCPGSARAPIANFHHIKRLISTFCSVSLQRILVYFIVGISLYVILFLFFQAYLQ